MEQCIHCGACCKGKKCGELIMVERMGTPRVYGLCNHIIIGQGKCTKRINLGEEGEPCAKGMKSLGISIEHVEARMQDYLYALVTFQELHLRGTRSLKESKQDIMSKAWKSVDSDPEEFINQKKARR